MCSSALLIGVLLICLIDWFYRTRWSHWCWPVCSSRHIWNLCCMQWYSDLEGPHFSHVSCTSETPNLEPCLQLSLTGITIQSNSWVWLLRTSIYTETVILGQCNICNCGSTNSDILTYMYVLVLICIPADVCETYSCLWIRTIYILFTKFHFHLDALTVIMLLKA